MTGFVLTQALHAAADLRLADALASGPLAPADLGRQAGADAQAVTRVLRLLSGEGIFQELPDGRFENTFTSALLRDGVPGSQRPAALHFGTVMYQAAAGLADGVRTGTVPFEAMFGEPFFDYMRGNPDAAVNFDGAMASSLPARAAFVQLYGWSRFDHVVDVGGGTGELLAGLLARNPALTGVVVDRPALAEQAQAVFQAAGVADRAQFAGGDFFDDVPAGGDVYLLSSVLHDWSDPDAGRILAACRRVMAGDARLVVVDAVMAAGNPRSFTRVMDVMMLTIATGRERTEEEWRALLESSGFRLERLVASPLLAILEAFPA
jgi:SAM-dependent methyltransferase